MAKFKKLTSDNKDTFFLQEFYELESCIYDEDYFLWGCVKEVAKKFDVEIEYISKSKDDVLYSMTESFGFWITRFPKPKLEQINKGETFLFDPNQLCLCGSRR